MAAQAGLFLAWSETLEDTFCRVVAHMFMNYLGRGLLERETGLSPPPPPPSPPPRNLL